jgi:hypothetical protein
MGVNGKLQLQFETRLWHRTGAWPGRSTGLSFADTVYRANNRRLPSTRQFVLLDQTSSDFR